MAFRSVVTNGRFIFCHTCVTTEVVLVGYCQLEGKCANSTTQLNSRRLCAERKSLILKDFLFLRCGHIRRCLRLLPHGAAPGLILEA